MATMLNAVACDADSGRHQPDGRGLRAGFATERPYAWADSAGAVTGEAPATLEALASALGVTPVTWLPLEFAQLIPALNAGRIDVIATGMFITPERSELVRFTVPTVCVKMVMVVPAPASPELDAPEPECAECRFVVIEGAAEQTATRHLGRRVMAVPDLRMALEAIRSERSDGLLISAPTGRELVRNNADLRLARAPRLDDVRAPRHATVSSDDAGSGCAAFAFRTADAVLANRFDSALRQFRGTPEHLAVLERFGFTAEEAAIPAGESY